MLPSLPQFQRSFAAALDAPASGAMAVYRNTVLHGAVEALRANYPVIERVVGPEMFEAIAVDFAWECPPRRPVLALYGEGFAQWIEGQAWAGDLPYLADLARVERMRIESLMAADAEAISSTQLRDDQVALHPALRFTWLSTPAMSIWLAHQRPVSSELALEWKPEGALFARPSAHVMHSPRIGRAAHRLLSGIRRGESVPEALAACARLHRLEDGRALFTSLVNLGAFVAPGTRTLP